jgi:hypothetical protein
LSIGAELAEASSWAPQSAENRGQRTEDRKTQKTKAEKTEDIFLLLIIFTFCSLYSLPAGRQVFSVI